MCVAPGQRGCWTWNESGESICGYSPGRSLPTASVGDFARVDDEYRQALERRQSALARRVAAVIEAVLDDPAQFEELFAASFVMT